MHELQLKHTTHCNTLQHTATHCNTLRHTATLTKAVESDSMLEPPLQHKHCNALQRTATHWNTLQHIAPHCNACNALQRTAPHCDNHERSRIRLHAQTSFEKKRHCNTLQHAATRCNTLQHIATHCNILQHTAALTKGVGSDSMHESRLKHSLSKTGGRQRAEEEGQVEGGKQIQ